MRVATAFCCWILSLSANAEVVLCTGMSNANQECQDWIRNNTTGYKIINGSLSSHTYTRFRNPDSVALFWEKAELKLSRQGLTFADVDIVYNKNITTCGRRGETPCGAPLKQRKQELIDGMLSFHEEVAKRMPQAIGYHASRTEGMWCDKAPEDISRAHAEAIQEAIAGNSKWSMGPDLSTPSYVREDFVRDGCHPAPSGLAKMTAVINTFFSDKVVEPPVESPHESLRPPAHPR